MSVVVPPLTVMGRAELDALLELTLSDEQWQCVSTPLEPFVIVAGAGTGKTAVMAARVLWLVASGLVAEHEVLGLTFTNKAASELAERVSRYLAAWRAANPADRGSEAGEPTIATYHSFARRLIDEQGLRVGIEPGARLLSAPAVAQLAYGVVCRSRALSVTTQAPSSVAAALVRLDANLAEQAIDPQRLREHDHQLIADIDALERTTAAVRDIRSTAARRIELSHLVETLRQARRDVGGLDFSDHMRLCVDLVSGSPELVATMRSTYRVVLLDEYQDTSIAQRIILATLFGGSAVTAVGDPMQAIYGWRSASVANIDAFAAHFGRDGVAGVQALSANRRSGSRILEAANDVAADLRARHPRVKPLRPPQPRAASVRAALLPTVDDERAWIADQVAGLVGEGVRPGDIGVLARANDQLGPLLEQLSARGVPASVSGVAALTASPYATAVLATLRVLDDPADNRSMAALLAGPRWRIGPQDLRALARRAEVIAGGAGGQSGGARPALPEVLREASLTPDPVERPSLLEAAADPGAGVSAPASARLAELLAELRVLQSLVTAPLPDLVGAVATLTGARIEAELAAGPSGTGDVGLAGLLRLVEGFSDAEGRTGLGAFLAYLDAAEQLGADEEVDLPTFPGSVQLMTMHKAKGLEFPVVVLPHLCREVFPGGRPSERWTTIPHVVPTALRDDRHVLPRLAGLTSREVEAFTQQCREHDRTGDDRLAYVAVTRAEDRLIASGHWWGPSQRKPRGPSAYLEALLGHADDPGADLWATQPEPEEGAVEPENPLLEHLVEVPWPVPDAGLGQGVRAAAAAVDGLRSSGALAGGATPWQSGAPSPEVAAPPGVARTLAAWDAAIEALLARIERPAGEAPVVALPSVLSASATMELAADPAGFAERLLRPMPRRRNRHAERGTAFHAWVEARLGVQPLIPDDELPGAADEHVTSAEDLTVLKEAFEALPYAQMAPVGLEVPFTLALGGRVIRGRIDAVFPAHADARPGQRWEVVDWKTSARDVADPLQLAIYRLAWARHQGVPPEAVGAAFAFVRSGTVQRLEGLPDEQALAQVLAGQELLDGEAERPDGDAELPDGEAPAPDGV